MTFFEIEQISDFMHSLERHLDAWCFNNREMRIMLAELSQIEEKLRRELNISGSKLSNSMVAQMVTDLCERTQSCRSSIQERLMS